MYSISWNKLIKLLHQNSMSYWKTNIIKHGNKISKHTETASYLTSDQNIIPHWNKISYHNCSEISYPIWTKFIPQHWGKMSYLIGTKFHTTTGAKSHTTLQQNCIPLHLGEISYYTGIKLHTTLKRSLIQHWRKLYSKFKMSSWPGLNGINWVSYNFSQCEFYS